MVIGCLQLSDVSIICCVVNLRQRSQNIWGVSCTECTRQENDFELIPMIEMETRHPVQRFVSKRPANCNDCRVMAA